jgi:hypothetical protein
MKLNSTRTKIANTPATVRAQRKVLERMNKAWRIGSRRLIAALDMCGGASLPAI